MKKRSVIYRRRQALESSEGVENKGAGSGTWRINMNSSSTLGAGEVDREALAHCRSPFWHLNAPHWRAKPCRGFKSRVSNFLRNSTAMDA